VATRGRSADATPADVAAVAAGGRSRQTNRRDARQRWRCGQTRGGRVDARGTHRTSCTRVRLRITILSATRKDVHCAYVVHTLCYNLQYYTLRFSPVVRLRSGIVCFARQTKHYITRVKSFHNYLQVRYT